MAELKFKDVEAKPDAKVSGSYIKLTGKRLERFNSLRKALGHGENSGIKEVGDQVADFGLEAMEHALAEAVKAAKAAQK